MSIYELPKIEIKGLIVFWLILPVVIFLFFSALPRLAVFGEAGDFIYSQLRNFISKEFNLQIPESNITEKQLTYLPQTSQEQAIIKAVKAYSPSVVSIVISKDVPILEQYYNDFFGIQIRQNGTQKQQIGGGSGFIISPEGMILTNKHVVQDKTAEYTVLTNDGKKFPAKVVALDPVQDLAILKIDQEKIINQDGGLTIRTFPTVKLGDSDNLQIGQTVIAIGNALGEFQNTVSVGVISGLGRTITAQGGGTVETLEDVIQTDAAINKGNSGGPLLNLRGAVIGINAAMSVEGENIGFAIPINKAKKDIESVSK